MSKRRNAALAVLALAAAAVFVLPASSASAGTSLQSNACANSVTANFSQIEVTTNGTDGLDTVLPAGATTTSGLSQQAAIPGAIFVAGYNLGLLVVGPNNIPANVRTTIEATNTAAPSVQNTNVVGGTPPNGSVTVSTVITDPDGVPGTGDESATDASFSVSYNDLSWTAGASGTIEYRQESIPTSPPTAASNSLLINALVGGVFNVQFRCAPGIVTGMNPGVITLTDPAASFDSTLIEPVRQISIDDAAAVNEGGAATFTVSLDQPSIGPVTVQFATADGTATAPGDYTSATGTVTFAPGVTSQTVMVQTNTDALVEGTEAFNVNLSNATGNAAILDGLGVGTILDVVGNRAPTANAGPDQTVPSGATVQLAGSGTDPDPGDTLNFAWSQTSGPTVTLSDPNSATPTFTAPTGPATLTFDLTVCDRPAGDPDQLCNTDSVTITVSPPPTISISDASATEGGAESFTVTLSSASAQTVTVDFATADGTATAGLDYTSATGTVTFVPGDTSETVTVNTIDDALFEGGAGTFETFNVNLSNPTNATIADGLGVGSIEDNDGFIDKAGEVIVSGPVKAGATTKVYVFRVSNVGSTTNTVDCATEIQAAVLVNGVANGSVSCITASKTIGPGARARFRLRWSGDPLPAGTPISFTACVNEAGDVDTSNDCGSVTRTT